MAQKIPITQDNWNNNVPEDLHSVSEEIKEKVNIDADGYVIYPNNDRGSHITDHLKYHFKIPGAERPRDSLPRFSGFDEHKCELQFEKRKVVKMENITTDNSGRDLVFVVENKIDPLGPGFPAPIYFKGYRFRSLSQYYFARMALEFDAYSQLKSILAAGDRYELFARGIREFNYEHWFNACEDIMFTGILEKVQQNKPVRERLLETGTSRIIVVDENDAFWGNGLNKKKSQTVDPDLHPGSNRLGMMLMRIRGEMSREPKTSSM